MNYSTGKKLTIVGFGLYSVVCLCNIGSLILWASGSMPYSFHSYLGYAGVLSLGVATLGYIIMWLAKKNTIDMITAGAVGISILLYFLVNFDIISILGMSYIFGKLISLMSIGYYLVMAWRAKDTSAALAIAFACLFIYQVFLSDYVFDFLVKSLMISHVSVAVVSSVTIAIGSALCFIQAKAEKQ